MSPALTAGMKSSFRDHRFARSRHPRTATNVPAVAAAKGNGCQWQARAATATAEPEISAAARISAGGTMPFPFQAGRPSALPPALSLTQPWLHDYHG